MRKVAAAALAVPVLALIYLPVLARRPVAARLGLVAGVGIVIVAAAAFGLSRPIPATASQPSAPITALAADAFRSVGSTTDLRAAVNITFSEAMDPDSVAASLRLDPATDVHLAWNPARTVLTVRPAARWAAGAYQTITVEAGALAATGRPMAGPVRAAFVTRAAASGRIQATRAAGASTAVTSAFRITFDRPVAAREVAAALRITPAIGGTLTADTGRPDVTAGSAAGFTWTPSAQLAAATTYHVSLGALTDVDGAAINPVGALVVTTSDAPHVVRFRPGNGTTKVDRRAPISVRFSEPMSHVTTRTAFTATASGKPVRGTFRFAEGSTVLVFQPSSALPAGATVVVTVAGTATSAHGVAIGQDAHVTLTTMPATKPASTPARSTTGSGSRTGSTAGGAVGGGSWGAVEVYYLHLMNCTRTGGWVTSTGSCSSPGGRNVAALRLDSGISSKVSRPYAKKLAVNNLCTHFSGGNPGNRLSAAGYTSYIWAENLGCRSGNPYTAVLGSHLYFQSEKSYNGGHYVNLMNPAYDRVGIGVWVSGGRVRVCIDFYHPR